MLSFDEVEHMRCFIAIDSGGTKTEALLFDETGHILRRIRTSGCNAMDIGIDAACTLLLDVVSRLAQAVPPGAVLTAVYSGVAATDYFGGALGKYVAPHFPNVKMRFEDDAVNLISGVLGHRNGCCIVGGTGSSLYARIDGQIHHLGGWGYLIDTGGSGYALGRDALLAVFRSCDGRSGKTLLYELVERQIGQAPEESIPQIYAGGRPYIASFAHTVFEARALGDRAAREIFEKGVHALAELTFAAEPLFGGEFDVVLGGGIFAAFPEYAQALRECASPRARLIRSDVPPILGGVIEALSDGGIEITPEIRETFLREYAQLCEK